MKEHTPSAWDLDVRSFVQTLARRKPGTLALTSVSPGSTVSLAIDMADAVQKAREERCAVAEKPRPPMGFQGGRRKPGEAFWPLPPTLPIGTRAGDGPDMATGVVALQEKGGMSVYWGEWNGHPDCFWPASEIDWDHVPGITGDPK